MGVPAWELISYESSQPLSPKGKGKGAVHLLDSSSTAESAIEIYVFDQPFKRGDRDLIYAEVDGSKFRDRGALIYPRKHHEAIERIFGKVFPERELVEQEKAEPIPPTQDHFASEFLHLVADAPAKGSLVLRYYVLAAKKPDEVKEGAMATEQLVTEFWNQDPTMKAILLHTFLLQQSGSAERFSQVRRRVGIRTAQLEAHMDVLGHMGVMEIGGGCTLRGDTGASQTIGRLVMEEYDLDQDLGGMTGTEFLNISFDGRQAQAKRFANAVKETLLKNLPYLRCIDIRGRRYAFELFLPGKWFIVFLCKTSTSSLKPESVSLAHADREWYNNWLVMRSAFAAVCGPTFSAGAVSMAEGINVSLIKAAGFLKLARYLSSLEHKERIAVYDYFPLIFALSSGLVPMEEAIATLREMMEEER